MFQQIFAILIIFLFLIRLIIQKKKGSINTTEFWWWVIFWFLTGVLIVFIKKIDALVASLGFSESGINILFYLAVIFLFYLVFKLRLKLETINRQITTLSRHVALNHKKKYES